jgi:hypothetical protein
VGEETLGVAQEGALALDAPELLEEGEREDLRVRETLERLLAPRAWIEERVLLVYEAEQHGQGLFQGRLARGMLHLGHPRFLSPGIRMAPVLLLNRATLI